MCDTNDIHRNQGCGLVYDVMGNPGISMDVLVYRLNPGISMDVLVYRLNPGISMDGCSGI